MVVGGLFGQSSRHAIDVANQALDMVECATRVRHPKTLEKGDIQVKEECTVRNLTATGNRMLSMLLKFTEYTFEVFAFLADSCWDSFW